MNIHEYQAKEVLAKHGVAVPKGVVIENAEKAAAVSRKLGTDIVVVKAQIHAGGRGKGGGVKLAKSPEEAKVHANKIIGMTLVTPQTGSEGPGRAYMIAARRPPAPPTMVWSSGQGPGPPLQWYGHAPPLWNLWGSRKF